MPSDHPIFIAKYFIVLLAAFFSGVFLINLFKNLPLKFKASSSNNVPLTGGISIALSFIAVCLIGLYLSRGLTFEAIGIIIASSVMFIFGLVDDIKELSVRAKFIVQIISTGVLILFGIRTNIVYIGTPLNIAITLIWVLGITNAFNHLDVMDGIAGVTALVAAVSFYALAVLNINPEIAILSCALAGSILAFLRFNLPPAKIYMGNSGSHFLGFILAALAMVISYAPLERKIALFSPMLILGLAIFDTVLLIIMRILRRRSPFKKSEDHLVLKFLKAGYSKKTALMRMLFLAVFFSFCGIILSRSSNLAGLFIIGLAILVSLCATYKIIRVSIDG